MKIIYAAGSYHRQAQKIIDEAIKVPITKGHIVDLKIRNSGLNDEKIEECDIYHCHSCYSHKAIPLVKTRGAKVILQRDSSHVIEYLENLERENQRWWNAGYKGFCNNDIRRITNIQEQISEYDNADYILLASNLERDSFLKHGYPKKKLKVIPFTADGNVFKITEKTDFEVVLGGGQNMRKGYPIAKEACKKLSLNLSIIHGVDFKDMPKTLSRFPVMLAPAIDDGYPHMVLAGMCCGAVPIVSNLNGVKDLIKHGKNGFIVDVVKDSPEKVVENISEILKELKRDPKLTRQIGQRARASVIKRTWNDYSKDICKFYEEVMKK